MKTLLGKHSLIIQNTCGKQMRQSLTYSKSDRSHDEGYLRTPSLSCGLFYIAHYGAILMFCRCSIVYCLMYAFYDLFGNCLNFVRTWVVVECPARCVIRPFGRAVQADLEGITPRYRPSVRFQASYHAPQFEGAPLYPVRAVEA